MEKTKVQTFVLSQNEHGQKIYSNSDRTKRFILEHLEDGDLIPYNNARDGVKIEDDSIMSEDDDEEFDVMGTLESATEMDNHLMQELDSDLVNADGGPFIPQYMNIQAPLSKLRTLLEQRLHVNLSDYDIYLQGMQKLENDKTLVEQCIEGQGMVQVNVQIQANFKRINILDVLKPGDDFVEENESPSPEPPLPETPKSIQWQVDSMYRKEQDRLKISHDPEEWTQLHVKHWIQWAVRQFNLSHIKLSDWAMTGKQLHDLKVADFHKIVPEDPGNVFWTHLELLRQMKVVAVRRDDGDAGQSQAAQQSPSALPRISKQTGKIHRVLPNYVTANTYFDSQGILSCRGNNGQIQLWQFLLELLTNIRYKSVISWTGNDGEFKLRNPQIVAQLWGERKNKPAMNYEKLSRALRYYYDGDMIAKVHGERFVYKFVCNLKDLLGYDARELSNLVNSGNPMITL